MLQKLTNRFVYLDSLIRKRATGSPKELATRLGITERAWYNLRDELVNDLGLPLLMIRMARPTTIPKKASLFLGSCENWIRIRWRSWKAGVSWSL
ncbi:hypothetical protein GO730_29860 [Spirosoma sp. HMF3257]|uniref:hypothetical protein n=1 Tax=Spirosoma telluris TaxID=2183553 RepID=UPI0011B93E56|nr:hypothetical protein [Spirosoma telluris]